MFNRITPTSIDYIVSKFPRLCYIDLLYSDEQNYSNDNELVFVMDLLTHMANLLKSNNISLKSETIGIITPYKA
jgi:hypothetical protein